MSVGRFFLFLSHESSILFCFLSTFVYICSMKAYVYTHTRLDTNEVFYVGIGTQDNYKRASRSHNRTNYWNNIVKKCGWKVDIVFDNLTWDEACNKEKELIKKIGRVDLGTGTLVNLTDGGEGTLKRIVTNETKAKMSKTRKGKLRSELDKLKISTAMKGKNAKKVIDTKTGIIYNSIIDASLHLGVSRESLSGYLTSRVKNKTNLAYL
jgi:hypothetical protein